MRFDWCKANLHTACEEHKYDHCEMCNIARSYQHGYEIGQEDMSKTGWIPVSDIRKLQDILYLHIDSLEGTRNIVEAGMLSAWKEVVEYLDGMLGEDGEA